MAQISDTTSVEHNKDVSRRWIEVFNERDDTGEADVRGLDYVAYAPASLELNRFADGRVVEHWFQLDSLTLLQQLGLIVVPGPRLVPRVLAHQVKKLRRRG